MSTPTTVNVEDKILRRWPSFGGLSPTMLASIDSAPAWVMSLVHPMFSPAAVQVTPAFVSRVPRSGSPGSWCDSWFAVAIARSCACALACRPAETVSAGSPCWARAELMAATTAAAIEAVAVDTPLLGDGACGAGAGGRGGWAVVARGTSVVREADSTGVLAARSDGRVAFGGPGGLTWVRAVAWLGGGPMRDDPVTGAAAAGAGAVDVPGRASGRGLACSTHPATAAVVAAASTAAAAAATQYRIPAADRCRRRCRPTERPFDDIGPPSWRK